MSSFKRLLSNSSIHQSFKTKVMRKISLVLIAAMLLSSTNILAKNGTNDPGKSLSTQIAKLLSNNTFTDDQSAEVRFTLNNERQIVVLSVATKNIIFEGFVKASLNYRTVDLDDYREGKVYTVPVRVVI